MIIDTACQGWCRRGIEATPPAWLYSLMAQKSEERITLRLPVELHKELVKEKDRQRRSLNNLIIVALEKWLEQARR